MLRSTPSQIQKTRMTTPLNRTIHERIRVLDTMVWLYFDRQYHQQPTATNVLCCCLLFYIISPDWRFDNITFWIFLCKRFKEKSKKWLKKRIYANILSKESQIRCRSSVALLCMYVVVYATLCCELSSRAWPAYIHSATPLYAYVYVCAEWH